MFREFSLFKTSMGILLLSYKPICNFFSQVEMKDQIRGTEELEKIQCREDRESECLRLELKSTE